VFRRGSETPDPEANADLIVCAVNVYDDLLDACRASLRVAKAWLHDAAPDPDDAVPSNPEWAAAKSEVDRLEAVIAKAMGAK
jgi:hypothetical protein